MLRLVIPAACLVLAGPAAAGSRLATLSGALPLPGPASAAPAEPPRDAGPLRLRRAEPEVTSALPPAPARPACPPARRVGTGAGFCLIN